MGHCCDDCLLSKIRNYTLDAKNGEVTVKYDPPRTYDDGDGRKDTIENICDVCRRWKSYWQVSYYQK